MFFFKERATAEISTLSLHGALPISGRPAEGRLGGRHPQGEVREPRQGIGADGGQVTKRRAHRGQERPQNARPGLLRSEEHTSELQSRQYLVCRLLLEKKERR